MIKRHDQDDMYGGGWYIKYPVVEMTQQLFYLPAKCGSRAFGGSLSSAMEEDCIPGPRWRRPGERRAPGWYRRACKAELAIQ
jgi:hypothetical protein